MSYRLLAMRGLLRTTGSIWLHCDPTASHYIKVMMDGIFGHENFRNETIWKRTSGHSDSNTMGSVHDTLLHYTASDKFIYNRQYVEYDSSYIQRRHRHKAQDGRRWMDDNLSSKGLQGGGYQYEYKGVTSEWRVPLERMKELDAGERLHFTKKGGIRIKRYLDEMKGVAVNDVWTDIPPINSQSRERLGYPTQKPVALLSRIIKASSNEGDVVFDPFCGCGTTIFAAHVAKRNWIGCDIAWLSVGLSRDVLKARYGLRQDKDYNIQGVPKSVDGARELFESDPHQFQNWAVEYGGGFCSGTQSGDRGVDGRIHFETVDGLRNMVISVKGGRLQPAYVRELRGVLARDDASKLAGFICLEKPTPGMLREAAEAGMYEYQGKPYERLQIRTIDDLLDGRGFDTPTQVRTLDWMRQTEMAF